LPGIGGAVQLFAVWALAAPPQEMQKISSDAKRATAHGTIEKMKPRIPDFMFDLTPATVFVIEAKK
jgi:hypothetical protein